MCLLVIHKNKRHTSYSLNTRKVFTSREVKFYENYFPFHYNNKEPIRQFFLPQDSKVITQDNVPMEL